MPTVIPRIVAKDSERLVQFIRRVFDARGEFGGERPSEMLIGDSLIMISEAGERAPMPAFLYVYVDDVEATHKRAVAEGVTVVEEPTDTPYGHRRSMVEDAWGNVWQIARPLTSP